MTSGNATLAGGAGPAASDFVVDLEGFEGPLDLLLDLARGQKVDLRRISLVALADQYLAYLAAAREARLEIAAEYLVMAAWLTYLKSQLLLPLPERAAEDPEAIASALADRLRTLEAIRRAAAWLKERPALGQGRLARGAPEAPAIRIEPRWTAGLGELLRAYGVAARRREPGSVRLPRRRVFTVDAALERLLRLLSGQDWRDLMGFLPPGLADGIERRGAMAASLVAGLELARTGAVDLQQTAPFGPIMVRRR
jgi:segregation and condensation protein A